MKNNKNINFFLGVSQARSICSFAWAGVFRGTLRSRASAAQAQPSHRPTLRCGRTPSTSRRAGAHLFATSTPGKTPPRPIQPILILHLITLLGIITSCVRVQKPADVLDQDTMATLLADIHLLEGRRIGDRVLYTENAYMRDYYTRLFEKHGVTEEQYRRSHYFYTQYPDLFSKVYDRTIEILQQKQIESENLPNTTTQPPD